MNHLQPILVGESNPYGEDPYFALYPAPQGSGGQRLAEVIFGMRRGTYLASFERRNLCPSKWRTSEARDAADAIQAGRLPGQAVVLLGRRVHDAWYWRLDRPWVPFTADAGVLSLPHPSGLSRLWNEPASVERARVGLLAVAPHLASDVGWVEREHARHIPGGLK